MLRRRFGLLRQLTLWVVCAGSVAVSAAGGVSSIRTADMKEWLSYVVSDELQGMRRAESQGHDLCGGLLK